VACGEKSDFIFPMEADIFYPIVDQGAYGNVKKTWMLDRTVGCSVGPAGSANKEEIKPNVNITQSSLLIGRVREDIRISDREDSNAITNIIITNIRDKNCNPIYVETSGPRKGKSTIFEIATNEPFTGPFGNVDYFKLILRRSENQAVDI
jgi:hypothetical protein